MTADVLFYGDPHGIWQPLLDTAAANPPRAVVLLGDMDLDEPLEAKLAPLLDAGIDVRWIPGNHDGDDTAWHDRLFNAGLGLDDANLNARIALVGGLRIAGLGGVFRNRVWNPDDTLETPRPPERKPDPTMRTRANFLQCLSGASHWRGGIPLRHRVSIFPEDFDALRVVAAEVDGVDVLVTHEAPSAHHNGFAAIDQLARDIDADWIVHGHHHVAYESATADGVRVRGLGMAEPWRWTPSAR